MLMETKERIASRDLAYDALKFIFNKMVFVFTVLLLIALWLLYESKTALDLNTKTLELYTQAYDEMKKANDIQAIYYNNMKAKIEALNEANENE